MVEEKVLYPGPDLDVLGVLESTQARRELGKIFEGLRWSRPGETPRAAIQRDQRDMRAVLAGPSWDGRDTQRGTNLDGVLFARIQAEGLFQADPQKAYTIAVLWGKAYPGNIR